MPRVRFHACRQQSDSSSERDTREISTPPIRRGGRPGPAYSIYMSLRAITRKEYFQRGPHTEFHISFSCAGYYEARAGADGRLCAGWRSL